MGGVYWKNILPRCRLIRLQNIPPPVYPTTFSQNAFKISEYSDFSQNRIKISGYSQSCLHPPVPGIGSKPCKSHFLLKSSSSHTSTPHKMQNHRMAPVCKRPHDSPKVSSTLFKPSGLLSNHQVSTQSPFSEHRPPQRRRDGKEAGLRHRQANTPAQIQRHRTSGGGGIIFLDQGESFVGCKDIKPFIEPYNP